MAVRLGFSGLGLNPIALALERIGRQRHLTPIVGLVEALPIHLRSSHVQGCQALQHLLPLAPSATQRRRPQALPLIQALPA